MTSGALSADLPPAAADLAQDQGVGDKDVVEDDFVEVVAAIEGDDRPDGDAGAAQIDDELAQPGVTL